MCVRLWSSLIFLWFSCFSFRSANKVYANIIYRTKNYIELNIQYPFFFIIKSNLLTLPSRCRFRFDFNLLACMYWQFIYNCTPFIFFNLNVQYSFSWFSHFSFNWNYMHVYIYIYIQICSLWNSRSNSLRLTGGNDQHFNTHSSWKCLDTSK